MIIQVRSTHMQYTSIQQFIKVSLIFFCVQCIVGDFQEKNNA